MKKRKNETVSNERMLKACIMFGTLAIILVVMIGIILKYQVEGEVNPPFYLSEINIFSTAEGIEREETWKEEDIYQKNDIYIQIKKNENAKPEDKIEKVVIENIKITKTPKIGQIKAYMPNSTEGRQFSFQNQYEIKDSLTYIGSSKSIQQNLEIGNQEGIISFCICNTEVGVFSFEENRDAVHDGTILKKLGITSKEDIEFEVTFNLAIYMENKVYRTEIKLNLPEGDIQEDGVGVLKKQDMTELVYKRSRN